MKNIPIYRMNDRLVYYGKNNYRTQNCLPFGMIELWPKMDLQNSSLWANFKRMKQMLLFAH